MTKRLTDDYVLWIREGLKKHALGEQVEWDIVFQVGQNDQTGQLTPTVFLYSQLKSADLSGGYVCNLAEIPANALNPSVADQYAQKIVEALLSARSKQLTAIKAKTNGGGRAPGPLVLPK